MKACMKCKLIVEGNICPVCQTSELTTNFKGYVIIIDPERSEIAKKLGATVPGKYAIKTMR
jgi:DNA-directed RNA polymerase subunit E"